MSHSEFLKEMGIAEWVSREPADQQRPAQQVFAGSEQSSSTEVKRDVGAKTAGVSIDIGRWIFFGSAPQGEAQILFQNIIRVLGLASHEWSWKNASEPLNQIALPSDGFPVVAFAFGGPTAQKITGERDALPQLRETILALNTGNDDEIPVIASYELGQALNNPKEKALLWQDLLLAKSVLQNI